MADERRGTLIGSVQRALRLLDAVGASDQPAPAKVLARRTGLALPTAYHLLRTMVVEGYLERLPDHGYVLGPRFAETARNGMQSLAHTALAALRDQLSLAVYFAVFSEGELGLRDVAESPKAMPIDLWVGLPDAAHATALGKCVLAWLPQPEREAYLSEHDLAALTARTIVDGRHLRDEVAHGGHLFVDREEYSTGLACVAVPVTAPGITGSIGIAAPVALLPNLVAAHQSLLATSHRVARALALTG